MSRHSYFKEVQLTHLFLSGHDLPSSVCPPQGHFFLPDFFFLLFLFKAVNYLFGMDFQLPEQHILKRLLGIEKYRWVVTKQYSRGNTVNDFVVTVWGQVVLGNSGETLCKVYDCLTTVVFLKPI